MYNLEPLPYAYFYLTAWFLAPLVIYYLQIKQGATIGLALTALAHLWMTHGIGIVVSSLAGHYNVAIMGLGAMQSTSALLSFAAGILVYLTIFNNKKIPNDPCLLPYDHKKLALRYFLFGSISYFLLTPILSKLPSGAALSSGLSLFMIIGLYLLYWVYHRTKDKSLFFIVLISLIVLPLFTIFLQGFLGFGISLIMPVLVFMFVLSKVKKIKLDHFVLGIFMAYFLLSFYATYIQERKDIRDFVWGGQGSSEEIASNLIQNFEWFNIKNPLHFTAIDIRLNQSALIGQAANYLESGLASYAKGERFYNAAIALIPRILWPEKPITGGGQDTVSNYTGISFAEGTSVGTGGVFELYISFGQIGVIVFFFILGIIIAKADYRARLHLNHGQWFQVSIWVVPILAIIPIFNLNTLQEITGAFAGGIAALVVVSQLFKNTKSRKSHAL